MHGFYGIADYIENGENSLPNFHIRVIIVPFFDFPPHQNKGTHTMQRRFSLDGYGPSKPAEHRRSRSGSGTRTIFDNAHTIDNSTLFAHIKAFQETGDITARNAAVTANLRLIPDIARCYLGRGLEFDDLVDHGIFGLMKAVAKFDTARGLQFSTYANKCIRRSISRALIEEGTAIYVPVYQYDRHRKIRKFTRQRLTETGEMPTPAEIATGTDLSTKKILSCVDPYHISHALSGDVIADDWQQSPPDRLVLNYEESQRARAMLRKERRLYRDYPLALNSLDTTPVNRKILQRYLGLNGYPPGLNLKEVGEVIGLTRERVRQIVNEIADQLELIHTAWWDYKWYLGHEARVEALQGVLA